MSCLTEVAFFGPCTLATRHSNSVIYDGGFGPHGDGPSIQRQWGVKALPQPPEGPETYGQPHGWQAIESRYTRWTPKAQVNFPGRKYLTDNVTPGDREAVRPLHDAMGEDSRSPTFGPVLASALRVSSDFDLYVSL